jgi:predicted lipid carrier protein YhbT
MPAPSQTQLPRSPWPSWWEDIPRLLLTPIPLFVLQPILGRMAGHVARTRPELFARLGPHVSKRFLIDPIDLPFVLVLAPNSARPDLTAYRRSEKPRHDACIAGTFLDLLDMIDGSLDGDALFFSRALRVSGDTEAVVALRNALDDFGGNVVDSFAGAFGPLSAPASLAISGLRAIRGRSGHG